MSNICPLCKKKMDLLMAIVLMPDGTRYHEKCALKHPNKEWVRTLEAYLKGAYVK